MSDVGGNDAGGRQPARTAPRHTDGELILLWTLPVAVILWIAASSCSRASIRRCRPRCRRIRLPRSIAIRPTFRGSGTA